MLQEELNKIIENHGKWLSGKPDGIRANLRSANLGSANLCDADLRSANLGDADLCDANLDYSSGLPMSCRGLNVHIDLKQSYQLLYHLLKNVEYSKNISEEEKRKFLTENNIALAANFHRYSECGKLGDKAEVKTQ